MTSDAYQPLDLSAYCNAGLELLAGDEQSLVGPQVLHGLPFRIGEGSRALIAFGADTGHDPVTIAIDAPAYSVIVAHRLLGSQLMSGGPMGEIVAEYVFRLSDGSEHRVPIRERFEIADLATLGGQHYLRGNPLRECD